MIEKFNWLIASNNGKHNILSMPPPEAIRESVYGYGVLHTQSLASTGYCWL